MTELTVLIERRKQADDALHRLMMGEKEVVVSHGAGRSVRFTETSAAQLRGYISDLDDQIAKARGFGGGRRPILPMI